MYCCAMLPRVVDAKQKLEQALKSEVQDKQAMAAKLKKVLIFLQIPSLVLMLCDCIAEVK